MGTRLVGVLAKPCMDGPGVPAMQPPHHLPIRCELAVLWVAQGYEVVAKPDQSSPYHASQHAQLVTLVNRTNHAYISVCIGCTMDDTCARFACENGPKEVQ